MKLLSALVLSLAAGAASAQVTLTMVPAPAMSAVAMSRDGRYVVGQTSHNGFSTDGCYIWDRATDTMKTFFGGAVTDASSVSDDGTRMLGSMNTSEGQQAALWQADSGWTPLGYLPNALECPSRSNGYALSGDGGVAVGLSWNGCSGRGFVWHDGAGAMTELQPLALGGNRASVISSDGNVIAGFAQGNHARTPAIWNANTGAGSLGDPTADMQGEFNGINDDGTVILGTAYMGTPDGLYSAVRWTAAGGVQQIAQGKSLPGFASEACDIASDGTVIGFDYLMGDRHAWIQPHGQGNLQSLVDWANDNGAEVGIDLDVVRQITQDGRHLCGFTAGQGAWVLDLPPCAADRNHDFTVDLNDFFDFFNCFDQTFDCADIDGENGVDLNDFFAFLNAFDAGC